MKKRIISLALGLIMALSLLPMVAMAADGTPYAVTGGNIYYSGSYIIGCDTSVTVANIPAQINGKAIYRISANAFKDCTKLTTVTIPFLCNMIDRSAFDGCTALTAINVEDGSGSYSSTDGVLFSRDRQYMIKYPAGKPALGYTVNGSVKAIETKAFADSNLTAVALPLSVTRIEANAFLNCDKLTDIYYAGTETQWKRLTVDKSGNDAFFSAQVHYQSKLPDGLGAIQADSNTLYQALEYLRVHKDEIAVTNDTDEFALSIAVKELLQAVAPGVELTVLCEIDWGTGWKATTEKEGRLVAHVILRSGTSQNDWTIDFTIPKVAVSQSDTEKLEEDAKAIAEAWADYYSTAIITPDNIRQQSTTLLNLAKAAVKNGSEVKWMLGDKMFSTWFEKGYIRGTLQMTLNGHKKELDLDVTIKSDGSATMNKPVLESATPSIPATGTAYASTQTWDLDGKKVTFQTYSLKDANGNPTQYVKIRDLALAMNGTKFPFSVDWDGSVNLVTGKSYTPNGSENKTPFSGDRAYKIPSSPTNVNGRASDLVAIVLTDDNGGQYTYYKFRDLGRALGFNVGWTSERGAFIETGKPYTDAD